MTALTLTTKVGNAEKLLAELRLARWELYPPQTDGFNVLGDLMDDLVAAIRQAEDAVTSA
jgi:hypothetical protein